MCVCDRCDMYLARIARAECKANGHYTFMLNEYTKPGHMVLNRNLAEFHLIFVDTYQRPIYRTIQIFDEIKQWL